MKEMKQSSVLAVKAYDRTRMLSKAFILTQFDPVRHDLGYLKLMCIKLTWVIDERCLTYSVTKHGVSRVTTRCLVAMRVCNGQSDFRPLKTLLRVDWFCKQLHRACWWPT